MKASLMTGGEYVATQVRPLNHGLLVFQNLLHTLPHALAVMPEIHRRQLAEDLLFALEQVVKTLPKQEGADHA